MGVAHKERRRAAGRVRARLVHHAGHRRSHQGRVEVLALAGGVPVVERREDRDRRVPTAITSNAEMPARYGGPAGSPVKGPKDSSIACQISSQRAARSTWCIW